MTLHFTILFILIRAVIGQHLTPCPERFSYEPRNLKSDKWYGVIRYSSPENTTGIWLNIKLDRPADLLGVSIINICIITANIYIIIL